jgi:hypothetical protein
MFGMCTFIMHALENYLRPPPVSIQQVHLVIHRIDNIDREIQLLKREQEKADSVYQYAVIEFQIEEFIRLRTSLSRRKTSLLARARKQGPGIDTSLYDRFD